MSSRIRSIIGGDSTSSKEKELQDQVKELKRKLEEQEALVSNLLRSNDAKHTEDSPQDHKKTSTKTGSPYTSNRSNDSRSNTSSNSTSSSKGKNNQEESEADLARKYNALLEAYSVVKQEKETLQTDNKKFEELNGQLLALTARNEGLQREVCQLQTDKNNANQQAREWEGHANRIQAQLDRAESDGKKQRAEVRAQNEKWRSQAEELQNANSALLQEIEDFKSAVADLERSNKELDTVSKTQKRTLDTEISKLRSEVQKLEKDKNDLIGNNSKLSNELSSTQEKHEKAQTQATDYQRKAAEWQGRATTLEKDLGKAERHVSELQSANSDLKSEIVVHKSDIAELKRKNGDLDITIKAQKRDFEREVGELKRKHESELTSYHDKLSTAQKQSADFQQRAAEWQKKASTLEQELEESKIKGAMLQGNIKVAIDYIHAVLKVRPAFADTLQDILRASGEGPAQQVVTHAQQVASQSGNRESTEPRVAKPAPVVFETVIQPRFSVKVPVFCAKNVADLPDVVDICNEMGSGLTPSVSFHLTPYDSAPDGGPEVLGIVLALASTDRVDIVDRELVANLREKKGCAEVLLIILRRGNDPSKFKPSNDDTIPSGVKNEKVLFQLVHFKGKVLMDADANKKAISKFFDYVKLALPK